MLLFIIYNYNSPHNLKLIINMLKSVAVQHRNMYYNREPGLFCNMTCFKAGEYREQLWSNNTIGGMTHSGPSCYTEILHSVW